MSLKLMGKKRGMTRIFNEKGESVACTVIEAEPNVIVQVMNPKKEGAPSVQTGAELLEGSKLKNVTKPIRGHFAKAKVEPRRHLIESPIAEGESFEVGQEIGVEYFAETQYVDISGVTKGKGFQGVMKRYNFRGGPASHGSGFHRTHGSTGMRSTPGRTLPGMKMAGHMGNVNMTVENLQVIKVDPERRVLLVKGAVPGCNGTLVYIRKSIKRKNRG
jgi:large subunit ribosomal protein L3